MRYKFLLILVFISLPAAFVNSQDTIDLSQSEILYGIITDGDTILMSQIETVYIFPRHKFNSQKEWRQYDRLVRNVKRVYPYAKMAGEKYDIVAEHMMSLKTNKERREYIKQVEAEILDEYENELKKLSITQGRILLKLIDREIGETSYVLLKELKGSFSAVFWQTLARIFGNNLKSEFDPNGEDKLLNEIMILLENGQL